MKRVGRLGGPFLLLQLMVAGNETSANALTWIFYLLARHSKHVHNIRDEIAAVVGGDAIDFRNLHQLDETMRVIDEALRLTSSRRS